MKKSLKTLTWKTRKQYVLWNFLVRLSQITFLMSLMAFATWIMQEHWNAKVAAFIIASLLCLGAWVNALEDVEPTNDSE